MRIRNGLKKENIAVFIAALSCLFISSAEAWAHAKKTGARLIVTKTDGTKIEAELLAVKNTTLILMEERTLADASVDISEVKSIRIKKRSAASTGFSIGFFTVGGAILIAGLTSDSEYKEIAYIAAPIYGLIAGGVGAIFGSFAGIDNTIKVQGGATTGFRAILSYLNRKARIPLNESAPDKK